MSKHRSVFARIEAFNTGRRADMLARKYHAMAKDPFAFFRATAHLFWQDWAVRGAALDDAPIVWCCGDLHLENFGSYRGDNRLVYFDVNDFDEGALAPATRDPARLLTSLRLAAESLSLDDGSVTQLERVYLDAYFTALSLGKARWIERPTSQGIVRDLLRAAKVRTRRELFAARTTTKNGKRRIRIIEDHTFRLNAKEKRRAIACVEKLAVAKLHPASYRVLDVAGRIAGKGSLGLERYVALVRGTGGQRRRRLLDLKLAAESSLMEHLPRAMLKREPEWIAPADRIVDVQRRMQAITPALLGSVRVGRSSFVVRELQPSEDKLALEAWHHREGRLQGVLETMGRLTAWAQLRSASARGADGIDALVAFAERAGVSRELSRYAKDYADVVRKDHAEFQDALSLRRP